MDEIWKPVPGYEGIYEVSSKGRVRSLDRVNSQGARVRGRVMKTRTDKDGYFDLVLSKAGEKTYPRVHRLVCEAFHGPAPEGKPFACHKDGNNQNNTPENLYWGSSSDNMQDAVRHGTHRNSRKTHCERGHELPKNRRCPECARVHARRTVERSRESGLAPDDPRHGTEYASRVFGCRCDRCREAVNGAARRRRARDRGTLAPDDPRHGTYSTYSNFCCRCDLCREALREYSRARAARKRATAA